MTNTLITTNNLSLRAFNLTDVDFILTLLNTPHWIQYIGDRNVHTPSDALNYLTNGPLANYQKYGYGAWLVMLKDTGQPIGMCGLFKRDYLDNPDLGFAFLPQFEGLGYGYESSMGALRYVRDNFNVEKLYATTLPDNIRSRRLLTRCGFTEKGIITPPGDTKELLLYETYL